MSELICTGGSRREEVRKKQYLYGLDYLEVGEDPTQLTVYFLGPAPDLDAGSLAIEGGARVRDIRVLSVDIQHSRLPDFDDFMNVTLDKAGDFSVYTLRVTGERIDPRYRSIEFNFKIDCANEFDCKTEAVCPPATRIPTEINYLAKDYASFRQVIFDRLAVLMPEWKERHVPDLGVALVEVLAYTGDYLSYYQDAVATEAYLDTARQRISIRRHARLVDYQMHEGCNARAWVVLEVTGDPKVELSDVYFITNARDSLAALGASTTEQRLRQATEHLSPGAYEVFEPVAKDLVTFHEAHGEIHFYTWHEEQCCLPKGATSATLGGAGEPELQVKPGDVLVFQEVLGPVTGIAADADPSHRHAVRLTRVTPATDPLDNTPIVEIEWREEDALPFPLCLSALLPAPDCRNLERISVARGNVILVDHGTTLEEDTPPAPLSSSRQECGCNRLPGDVILTSGRFRPQLKQRPLTFRQLYDAAAPASAALLQDPRNAGPAIRLAAFPGNPEGAGSLFHWSDIENPQAILAKLTAPQPDKASIVLLSQLTAATRALLHKYHPGDPPPANLLEALARDMRALVKGWNPVPDLLDAAATDLSFVAEMDNDGYAHLRFGDGNLGSRPDAGMVFRAQYRVGNGPAGNVGAQSIATLVTRTIALPGAIRKVSNPMAAAGGTAPESLAEVKLLAPNEFRTRLRRGILPDDYAAIALRDFSAKLQNAAATLRWTGTDYEVLLVVDPIGKEAPDAALLEAIAADLERYRRIGHELVVKAAQRVPLEIVIGVCVSPHFRSEVVNRAILDLFSNKVLASGRTGFFHPDNQTFGQGVYLSRIVALAQSAPGVVSVKVTTFQRYQQPATSGLDTGVLKLGSLEIAQADNDRNYPEHGKVEVIIL